MTNTQTNGKEKSQPSLQDTCLCQNKIPKLVTTVEESEIVCRNCGVVFGFDEEENSNTIPYQHITKSKINLYQKRQTGGNPHDVKKITHISNLRLEKNNNSDIIPFADICDKLKLSEVISENCWKSYYTLKKQTGKFTRAKAMCLTIYQTCRESKIPIEPPKKTHGSKEEMRNNPSLLPHVKLIDAISDLPKIHAGRITSSSDEYISNPNEFQMEMRKRSARVKDHVTTKNTPIVIERMKAVPEGGNWENIPLKLMQVDGNYSGIKNAHSMIYKRLRKDEPAITITNFRKGMIIHPKQNRLFSIREASRIQTFPDDYAFEGGLSDRQQQVADAVPVMLGKKVAASLLTHLHDVIKIASV